jgi:hypothetical protein
MVRATDHSQIKIANQKSPGSPGPVKRRLPSARRPVKNKATEGSPETETVGGGNCQHGVKQAIAAGVHDCGLRIEGPMPVVPNTDSVEQSNLAC